MNSQVKRTNETTTEWQSRISIKDTKWFRKGKLKRRFKWFYDLKFEFMMWRIRHKDIKWSIIFFIVLTIIAWINFLFDIVWSFV